MVFGSTQRIVFACFQQVTWANTLVRSLLLGEDMDTTNNNTGSLRCKRGSHTLRLANERTEMVSEYRSLVRGIARSVMRRTHSQADFDELMSWGYTGLLEAIDRFEEGGKATFATFAYYRIRGAMLDGIGTIAPLSRKCYRQAARAGDFHVIYATDHEPEDILDPRDELSPEHLSEHNELCGVLHAAIGKLPVQQQRLVQGHYFRGEDLQDAGKKVGISKSRASRAHATAIANLREEMRESLAMAA